MKPARSATKLWIVCSCALAIGFIALAYLNFVQYQNAQDSARLANGTITDLRYQLGLDQKSASPSPSVSISPVASSTPTPSASPTAAASPTPAPPTTPTPAPAGASAVTNQLAKLHVAASTTSATKTTLPAGTVVALTGSVTNKYQPVTVDGQSGYVFASYLKY